MVESITSQVIAKARQALRDGRGATFSDKEMRLMAEAGLLHILAKLDADEVVAGLGPSPGAPVNDEMPPVFSVRTLAERWRCSGELIRTLVAKGEIKSFRHGNLIRIPVEAVIERERVR